MEIIQAYMLLLKDGRNVDGTSGSFSSADQLVSALKHYYKDTLKVGSSWEPGNIHKRNIGHHQSISDLLVSMKRSDVREQNAPKRARPFLLPEMKIFDAFFKSTKATATRPQRHYSETLALLLDALFKVLFYYIAHTLCTAFSGWKRWPD